MLTHEEKKHILNHFLYTISGISDIEYQKRVWIKGEGPECDDFGETVCNFSGDYDPIIENYKDFGITDKQCHLLIQFNNEFEKFYRRHYLPQDFLDFPEWKKMTEMAKGVLQAFNYRKDNTTQ